ncbi:hypothetical protein BDW74DRAFT_5895 [Aspergillus multicolor]|uniref:uncharacterized protein n=1 Tax=Aspergillus multicolor TaxID=41759 RepID=UPI003CCD3D19
MISHCFESLEGYKCNILLRCQLPFLFTQVQYCLYHTLSDYQTDGIPNRKKHPTSPTVLSTLTNQESPPCPIATANSAAKKPHKSSPTVKSPASTGLSTPGPRRASSCTTPTPTGFLPNRELQTSIPCRNIRRVGVACLGSRFSAVCIMGIWMRMLFSVTVGMR